MISVSSFPKNFAGDQSAAEFFFPTPKILDDLYRGKGKCLVGNRYSGGFIAASPVIF